MQSYTTEYKVKSSLTGRNEGIFILLLAAILIITHAPIASLLVSDISRTQRYNLAFHWLRLKRFENVFFGEDFLIRKLFTGKYLLKEQFKQSWRAIAVCLH